MPGESSTESAAFRDFETENQMVPRLRSARQPKERLHEAPSQPVWSLPNPVSDTTYHTGDTPSPLGSGVYEPGGIFVTPSRSREPTAPLDDDRHWDPFSELTDTLDDVETNLHAGPVTHFVVTAEKKPSACVFNVHDAHTGRTLSGGDSISSIPRVVSRTVKCGL